MFQPLLTKSGLLCVLRLAPVGWLSDVPLVVVIVVVAAVVDVIATTAQKSAFSLTLGYGTWQSDKHCCKTAACAVF